MDKFPSAYSTPLFDSSLWGGNTSLIPQHQQPVWWHLLRSCYYHFPSFCFPIKIPLRRCWLEESPSAWSDQSEEHTDLRIPRSESAAETPASTTAWSNALVNQEVIGHYSAAAHWGDTETWSSICCSWELKAWLPPHCNPDSGTCVRCIQQTPKKEEG